MSSVSLAFARPWWLLAMVPLALLVWHVWRRPHGAASSWKHVVDSHLLPHLLTHTGSGETRMGLAMLSAGLLLAVVALAGPTVRDSTAPVSSRAPLRVIVIDLSPEAAPLLPRIKEKAAALVAALPAGETALLVYGDEPYLVVPPTSDAAVVARFLPELAADAMPTSGNRPDRAVGMIDALLARNAGAPARDLIWIAANEDERMRVPGRTDSRMWLLHAGPANEPGLAQAFRRSGGDLLRMQDDNGDVQRLASALAHRDRAATDGSASGRSDVGYWLLPLLLPLAALAFRRGVLVLLAPVVVAGLLAPAPSHALGLPDFVASRLLAHGKADAAAAWFSDPQWRAIAHYRAGRYEDAARLLEGRNDPDSLYNRGNALARHGRLVDALAAYEASLALRPSDADTIHNRDLVRRLLDQQKRQGEKQNPSPTAQSQRDAERVAEQWLRGVPDEPQSLLRRKLALEHQQRAAGKVEKPW